MPDSQEILDADSLQSVEHLYHARKCSENYDQYIKDAEQACNQDLAPSSAT